MDSPAGWPAPEVPFGHGRAKGSALRAGAARRAPLKALRAGARPCGAKEYNRVALFTRTGSGSSSVLSDAPLRMGIEESNGRGWRGKHCAKARQYGSPLLPVLRVDPV